jgi:hypothetical protein
MKSMTEQIALSANNFSAHQAYDELVASTVNGKSGTTKHFMEGEVEGVIKPQSLIY